MDSLLDFEECVKDSPEFRKLCNRMVEAGQAYNLANQLFMSSLAELPTYQTVDGVISCRVKQNRNKLTCRKVLMLWSVFLLPRFLPQLAETRRDFVRIGEDLETAAIKNAQVSRHKAGDAERTSHLLLATRKCYQHFALDYCLQVFSFVQAHFTFFHQGFDLFRDLEPTMKNMATQLSQLSVFCASKRKGLENQHLLVQQRDASGEQMVSPCPSSDDVIQGYLFKRSRRKTKTWKRCWFSIRQNQLIYRKSHKEDSMVLFDDLRLCAVKSLDHIDRRFCFELLSVQKCCALQADSEQLKQAWLTAVQGSIDLAYRERGVSPLLPQVVVPKPAALGVALKGHGNQRCCDCGEEDPRWASVNLGITMCIECSGIHRSLGVHLSKVRSLTLDSWESEQLKLLCVLGNDVMNGIYEARCSEEGGVKPTADSPRAGKETWIKEKYVEKKFVPLNRCPKVDAGLRLYQAALVGDLVSMARSVAEGAEVNSSLSEEGGRTALIAAAVGGSLLACEFLLQNGANVNYRDLRGQGALHAAATAGHTG
uniref:Arf-GAP with coiled-coil, ANK repeat and PH domain-containing protein n=1 Tax=Cynoglossus semilaevis TaxID=244447 RepID=A0A3P8W9R6_CYNSE